MDASALTLSELRSLELKYDGSIPAQAIADLIAQRPEPTELQKAAYRRADRAALAKREHDLSETIDRAQRMAEEMEDLQAEEAAGVGIVRLVSINVRLNHLRPLHMVALTAIRDDLEHIASERVRLGLPQHTLTAALLRKAG